MLTRIMHGTFRKLRVNNGVSYLEFWLRNILGYVLGEDDADYCMRNYFNDSGSKKTFSGDYLLGDNEIRPTSVTSSPWSLEMSVGAPKGQTSPHSHMTIRADGRTLTVEFSEETDALRTWRRSVAWSILRELKNIGSGYTIDVE